MFHSQIKQQMNDATRRDPLSEQFTPRAVWSRRLEWVERAIQILCAFAIAIHWGFHTLTSAQTAQVTNIVVGGLIWLGCSTIIRYRLCRNKEQFRLEQRSIAGVYLVWVIGLGIILLLAPWTTDVAVFWSTRWTLAVRWSEILMLVRIVLGGSEAVRNLHVLGWSPALILVLSFVFLDLVGAALLWLPASRAPGAESQTHISTWMAALYTSTSACCVTGLVIVDTGAYWSRTGQVIILCLFQIGGLGIMTFGGFVALFSGRAMQMGEGAMFQELFESDRVASVRRMVVSILVFTFVAEFVGAILLWNVWPELPLGDRAFYCVFHSVAAFCNAGFALMPKNANFVGYGMYWQVWGVIAGLVIVGGLGFGVLHDTVFYLRTRYRNLRIETSFVRGPRPRATLGLNAAIVLLTTAILLVGGTVGLLILDRGGAIGKLPPAEAVSAAWFQSTIARTAGFNSVDIAALQPASKLLLIILMFIGASPVSTGGGVKTASLAVAVLAFLSVLRGRDQVEIWGRTIAEATVKRASLIIGSGLIVVVVSTLLLTVFEQRGELFLDHLFETTSAFGTVGLSTGISANLSLPSLFVIIVTMFMGRVGPLTLFIAVGGRNVGARYQYPTEKITLG